MTEHPTARTGERICSVIIPCRNEAATLDAKLRNSLELEASGWGMEIIVCDDGSTDGTGEIAARWMGQHPERIRAVGNPGDQGKAHAVAAALEVATGEIICLTDADVLVLNRDLSRALAHFDQPNVGAVCSLQHDSWDDRNEPLDSARLSRTVYERIRDALRQWESRKDSTAVPHGQLMLIRRACGILPRPSVRADDIDISFRLRRAGHKVRFEPQLQYVEFRERTGELRRATFVRRAEAAIEVFLIFFKEFFFRPRYGFFGLVAFPLEFALYCIQPFCVLAMLMIVPLIAHMIFGWPGSLSGAALIVITLLLFKNIFQMEWYLIRAMINVLRRGSAPLTNRWDNPREGR